MKKNIELKARYTDLELAKQVLSGLNASFQWTDGQLDTYFKVPAGRLKLRQCGLHSAELISYNRPDIPESKTSKYFVTEIKDGDGLYKTLAAVLPVIGVIKKQRQLYFWHKVRIHLDEVEGLGTFIEFEAPVDEFNSSEKAREKVDFLIQEFGITKEQLESTGYLDLKRLQN